MVRDVSEMTLAWYYRCEVCGEGCYVLYRNGRPVATRIMLVDGVGQPQIPHAYHEDEKLDYWWGGHDAVPVPEPVGDAVMHAFERWKGRRLTSTGRTIEDVDARGRL